MIGNRSRENITLDSLETIESCQDAYKALDDTKLPLEMYTNCCMRRLLERGRRSEWAAFVIFQAYKVWESEDISEEKMFLSAFGRSKPTLYRWKQKLGTIDGKRSSAIARGIRSAQDKKEGLCQDSENNSGECLTVRHRELPDFDFQYGEPFSVGGQLEFEYADSVIEGFEQLSERVLEVLDGHGDEEAVGERLLEIADRHVLWMRTQITQRSMQHGRSEGRRTAGRTGAQTV